MSYFLNRQGRVYGPYSETELEGFVSEGRVLLSDPARTEALQEWAPLGAIWRGESGGNALTWPFHQRAWLESLWIPFFGGCPFQSRVRWACC